MLADVEIFKEIPGFNGRYQVSSYGKIRSCAKQEKWHFLWLRTDSDGYSEVSLWMKRKVFYKKVHRLVAEAFIPNPENKPQVNHCDTNKQNNNVLNLEWATSQEDADHRLKHGLQPIGDKHYAYGKFGANHKSAKIVLDTQTGIFYNCVMEAAIAKGIKYKTLVGKLCGNDNNNTSLIYA